MWLLLSLLSPRCSKIIKSITILYWTKSLHENSHKTCTRPAQDFCVGFENWGLVRIRLAPARDEKKVLYKGLVYTRLQKKLLVLCVQDPRTRPRTRLWIFFAQDHVRAPAQKGIVFFWVPQSIESPYKACTRLRTRLSYQEHWKLICFFSFPIRSTRNQNVFMGGWRETGGRPKRARTRPAQDSPQDRAQDSPQDNRAVVSGGEWWRVWFATRLGGTLQTGPWGS